MNGASISRGCSHGLISYFPLIVRVHLPANVNKMLTEKKIGGAKVNSRHGKRLRPNPLGQGRLTIYRVACCLRHSSDYSILYYTGVKLSMPKQRFADLDVISMGVLSHTLYSGFIPCQGELLSAAKQGGCAVLALKINRPNCYDGTRIFLRD